MASLDFHPDCHFPFVYAEPPPGQEQNEWQKGLKAGKHLELLVGKLRTLDVTTAQPFIIPKEYTVSKEAYATPKPFRAMAKKGNPTFRARTRIAKEVVQAAYTLLPEDVKKVAWERAQDLALVDAGAEATLGRLLQYYPKRGPVHLVPVTRAEAERAWREELGATLCDPEAMQLLREDEAIERLAFSGPEGSRRVHMNVRAGNGFPVHGTANDPEALKIVLGLADMVRGELEQAHSEDPIRGVELWMRQQERERPWLVALQGKAKGDYYKGEKVQNKMLRFYNNLGRQMSLNIQTGSQVLEEIAQSVLSDPVNNHSASGVALNHGGAGALVQALSTQLAQHNKAHVRMGDDSWVQMLLQGDDDVLLMFALDCSSFDLTQHNRVTQEIHGVLRKIFARVEPIAAALLHTYQRSRLVVVMLTLAYHLTHGGPSGLPLQSKVNGALMGVAIARVTSKLEALQDGGYVIDEEVVGEVVKEAGDELGLTVKLEQCSFTRIPPATNPLEYALARQPFLFIGYNFYYEHRVLSVYADLPRTLAQMRYPTLTWEPDKGRHDVMEVARAASTMLAWGRPTGELQPAFDAARALCLSKLDALLAAGGDVDADKLRWAVFVSPFLDEEEAEEQRASLKGLRGALARHWDTMWLEDGSVSSAEPELEVETPPAVVPTEADSAAGRLAPPTRKPTDKTAGRNPNTKVFAPAKPPRNPMTRVHENAGYTRAGVREADLNAVAQEVADRQEAEEYLRQQLAELVGRRRAEGDYDSDGERLSDLSEGSAERYLDEGRYKSLHEEAL